MANLDKPIMIIGFYQQGDSRQEQVTDLLKEYRQYTDKLSWEFIDPDVQPAVARQMEMREILPASDTESLLMKHLGAEPAHVDEVCRGSGLPVATTSTKGWSPLWLNGSPGCSASGRSRSTRASSLRPVTGPPRSAADSRCSNCCSARCC